MHLQDLPRLPTRHWAGNIPELVRDRLGVLRALSAREEMVLGRAITRPLVFMNSPRVVHEVLVEKAKFFEKSPGLRLVLHYLAGQGLFTSEGDLWKRQRKLMAPLFHHGALQQYAATMSACAARAVRRWSEGQSLDLAREMTRITMEVVGGTLFGAQTFDEADDIAG